MTAADGASFSDYTNAIIRTRVCNYRGKNVIKREKNSVDVNINLKKT